MLAPAFLSSKSDVIRSLSDKTNDPIHGVKNPELTGLIELLVNVFNICSRSGTAGTELWEEFKSNIDFDSKWNEVSPLLLEVAKATIVEDKISISTPELGEIVIKNIGSEAEPKIKIQFNDGTTYNIAGLSLFKVKENITNHILKNSTSYSKVSNSNQSSVDQVVRNYAIDSLVKFCTPKSTANPIARIPAPDGGAALSSLALEILKATPTDSTHKNIEEISIQTDNYNVLIRESLFAVELFDDKNGNAIDIPVFGTLQSPGNTLQGLKENIRQDVLDHSDMYSPEIVRFVKFSDSQKNIGTLQFTDENLSMFKGSYNLTSPHVTVEFLQNAANIPPLMEKVLRQKYLAMSLSDFIIGSSGTKTEEAFKSEISSMNIAPNDIEKTRGNYACLYQNIKDQLTTNLDEIAGIFARIGNTKESVELNLIECDEYQVIVADNGVRFVDKLNDNKVHTLVSFNAHNPVKDKFHQLVMQIKAFDENQYLNYAKLILKQKFDQLYADAAGTEQNFILSQLNVMIDDRDHRDRLHAMLDRQGNDISGITVIENVIQVTFNQGETINFANRVPTNNEYRGLTLLNDLQKLKGTTTTLRELITGKKGTKYDGIAMYILSALRIETSEHILGFKTNGVFDDRTKQFLSSFQIAGINEEVSKTYFDGLWANQDLTM